MMMMFLLSSPAYPVGVRYAGLWPRDQGFIADPLVIIQPQCFIQRSARERGYRFMIAWLSWIFFAPNTYYHLLPLESYL